MTFFNAIVRLKDFKDNINLVFDSKEYEYLSKYIENDKEKYIKELQLKRAIEFILPHIDCLVVDIRLLCASNNYSISRESCTTMQVQYLHKIGINIEHTNGYYQIFGEDINLYNDEEYSSKKEIYQSLPFYEKWKISCAISFFIKNFTLNKPIRICKDRISCLASNIYYDPNNLNREYSLTNRTCTCTGKALIGPEKYLSGFIFKFDKDSVIIYDIEDNNKINCIELQEFKNMVETISAISNLIPTYIKLDNINKAFKVDFSNWKYLE